jgi:D-alanyl-D-alanine carboxypeptidase/D-alanyl-D-alanine-endopeptidase (penicillin-binding protein 4)
VGVQVEGEAVPVAGLSSKGDVPALAGDPLLVHQSPPLIEIVTSIHATSDNHETECVYRLLGVRAGKTPDAVVREHWRARGREFEGLRMEDGCGLARADFIRPLDLARLQYFAARGPQGAAYRDSLLSKDDGALRWKGGAMSGVRATTGYVVGASGEEFCFALMVNHYTEANAVSELREALIAAMRRL